MNVPRQFYLTFGFHCDWLPGNSLKGLMYNISFSKQKNETNNCTGYKSLKINGKCEIFYDAASLPNLVGNEEVKQIMDIDHGFLMWEPFLFKGGTCHKHLWEFICHIILPKCDSVSRQVVHPCREMCWDVANGCKERIGHLVDIVSTHHDISSFNTEVFNCDYLPSHHGTIPCFYKKVTCDSPPDVTNGTKILNATQKDVYQLHDVVHYVCINETLKMVGDESVSCLYSGEWSSIPPTCGVEKEVRNSVLNPLFILLPIFLLSLFWF